MADNGQGKAEIITPPNTLKDKVSFGPGGIDTAVLEKAEQVIQGLRGSYLSWVVEDLKKLDAAYEKVVADPDNRAQHLKDVFKVAHDIKGQGGSFNYPLMTAIGNALCRFLEKVDKAEDGHVKVVKVCLDSLKVVIAQKLEGDGGQMGAQLVKGIEAVIAKVAAKH